jgi:energy-coupling factor transport system substrate-specific component
LDGEKWHRYGPEDGLDGEQFSLIHRDGYKTIWTTSEKGLFKLVNNRWEMVYQPGEEWEVNVLFIDSRENIWVGTEESGLYFFEAGDWKHYSSLEVLKDNEVNHIFEDRRENIWVTTKKGITKIALEKAH